MSGLNLYELSDLLKQALIIAEETIDIETGEVKPDWAEFLDAIEMERNAKLLACAALYKNWDAEAEAIRSEEKRLAARRHTLENKAESIKEWMRQNMQAGEKLSDSRCALGWRRSTSVEIMNVNAVPDEYCEIERTPKKKAIGILLKSCKKDDEITWAKLVSKINLQID